MRLALWLSLAAAAIASGALAAPVPATVSFSARLVDEKSGELLDGAHSVQFELFDAADGGASVWKEGRDVAIEDGLLFVALGEVQPLDGTVFNGRRLFLQVTLDGTVMEPRVSLESVPYAIRASGAENADAVGGIAAQDLQRRVTGTCDPGFFVIAINPDGTVTCGQDASGSGDITAVNAGSGLEGGGPLGEVTLSLLKSCAPGQVLKWDGAGWACADDIDTNAGGDVTAVTTAATSGLIGGGAAGDVGLSLLTSCAPGQLLKWDGAAWGCASDIDTDTDTNSGGDITAVSVGAAGGLTGGGATGDVTLSLVTTCGAGQMLKWNGSSWGCADDVDTDTNSGGDITAVTTGGASGLVGGTVAGDASLSLLTSCAPGQLLKWNGAGWACANDVDTDTDTNSGGDVTDVLAGAGLSGGGTSGAVTLNVVGTGGIAVGANGVSIDLPFTDARYVNVSGDTMTGALDMNNQRVLNRGCRTGYVRIGQGLCVENPDQNGFTFSGCANRCRSQGTHMCSSVEMRSILGSGVVLNSSVLLDWLADQDGDDSALYVNAVNTENPDGSRGTNTSSYCRCCANVE